MQIADDDDQPAGLAWSTVRLEPVTADGADVVSARL